MQKCRYDAGDDAVSHIIDWQVDSDVRNDAALPVPVTEAYHSLAVPCLLKQRHLLSILLVEEQMGVPWPLSLTQLLKVVFTQFEGAL